MPARVGRRTQITLTDEQHALLVHESACSGLPMAELVRRALDLVYPPTKRRRLRGYELRVGLWREPDPAVVARRVRPGWRR